MNSPARRLLEVPSDKKWHTYDKLPKGVGINTVQVCIDHGLVATKRVNQERRKGFETYRIAIRITRRGKVLLQK